MKSTPSLPTDSNHSFLFLIFHSLFAKSVNDLVSEYQQYQEATADEDAEFDEEQEAEVDEN